jgi:hypothetical protein
LIASEHGKQRAAVAMQAITQRILVIRDQKVLLDSDLAILMAWRPDA